jgi:hypothetical protein
MYLNQGALGTRPQMISLLGFALVNFWLWQYMLGERRNLWILLVVFWTWANLHGGFVIAVFQLGLALALIAAANWLPGLRMRSKFPFDAINKEDYPRKLRHLALVFGGSILASLVNPYTWRVYEEAMRSSLDRYAHSQISEWLAINFQGTEALLLGAFILLLVAYAFIRVLTTDARERGFIFLLVCLSSGVMSIPESDTFYTLMDNPHFILSQTLLLLIVAAYLLPAPSKKGAHWIEIGLMALATGALAELQPHMLVTAVGVGAVYTGLRWVRDRRIPIHLLVRLAASFLSGAAVAGVTYLLLNSDPITQAWQQQNQTSVSMPLLPCNAV